MAERYITLHAAKETPLILRVRVVVILLFCLKRASILRYREAIILRQPQTRPIVANPLTVLDLLASTRVTAVHRTSADSRAGVHKAVGVPRHCSWSGDAKRQRALRDRNADRAARHRCFLTGMPSRATARGIRRHRPLPAGRRSFRGRGPSARTPHDRRRRGC